MAELVKKLHFLKNGTEETAKAYSTAAEVSGEYITNKIDAVTAYVPIGETTDERATIGRVIKSGETKAILNTGKPPYGKVEHLEAGTFSFTVPKGVTKLRVTLVGGGGGGGGGATAEQFD